MPSKSVIRSIAITAGFFSLGVALALLAWIKHPFALAGFVLAQPVLGLAWARATGVSKHRHVYRDLLVSFLLWSIAFALAGLALLWPIRALEQTGSLASAIAFSFVLGLSWIMLWREWPVFAQASRSGGAFSDVLNAVPGYWALGRGLCLSFGVLSILLFGLILAPWNFQFEFPAYVLPIIGATLSLLVQGVLVRFGTMPEAPVPVETEESVKAPSSAINEEPMVIDGLHLARIPEDELDRTAMLYSLAHAGQTQAACALIDAGANPFANPHPDAIDQRSLVVVASLLPDLSLLRKLIALGASLNSDDGSLDPLIAATRDSWHGRPDAVMTLLANGADPRATDLHGNTPLHHAGRSTDPAVTALLLDAEAQINALNADGLSALAIACEANNWRVAKLLLERGAKIEPEGGFSCLISAARGEDDAAGISLLVKHKAKVDRQDAEGRSALHEAVRAGNLTICQELIDAGARTDVVDEQGMTAFLESCRSLNDAVFDLLCDKALDVDATDMAGRNAIALACEAGVEANRIKKLLSFGVSADQRDLQGRRPIEHALGAGRWALVAALDPDYPLPADVAEQLELNADRGTPREALREYLRKREFEHAKALFTLPDAPNTLARSTLLLEFCDSQDIDLFEWLLLNGARADARPSQMDSFGFLLLDRGPEAAEAIQLLIAHAQMPQGAGALCRWLNACNRKDAQSGETVALSLLNSGADSFACADETLQPVLTLAVDLGMRRLISELVARGANVNRRSANGKTALHAAISNNDIESLKLLVRAGASPTLRSADGKSALGQALAEGKTELAGWLDWSDWQLPGRALRDEDVVQAAMSGDLGAVCRLLALGFSINARDHQGCTALLRASGSGHEAVVEHLLNSGADRSLAARTGATPLSAAISMRQIEIVERLLQSGTNVEQALPGGITPLMLSAALGLPEMCARLIAAGADVAALDEQGHSALHCAALYGFTSRERARLLALFDTLLLSDAPADLPNKQGQTPLLLLLGARSEPGASCDQTLVLAGLDRLLCEPIDVNQADYRNLSALHLAAMHGLSGAAQELLQAGADKHARDSLGRTPHDLAVMRGFVDVAQIFDPRGANQDSPSMARFLRDPPKS